MPKEKQQFTEEQLYILEAALRYAIDQVRDSDIKVLDWGDGANQQFSKRAYKVKGDVVVSEKKLLKETATLLEDALGAVQHAKDDI